ncbi:hypothetical protein BT69DRAFT_1298716 [Atractiella rhizophila]|nr:hypothetical protein BT69DRAFT_1298716 [Atractiella rhizophila]
MSKRKVILMGKGGAGKSSMKTLIFDSRVAQDLGTFGPTVGVSNTGVRFLADVKLDVWDCGGQEDIMTSFLTTDSHNVFKLVSALIYIFDLESRFLETTDKEFYLQCLEKLFKDSPPTASHSTLTPTSSSPRSRALVSPRIKEVTSLPNSGPVTIDGPKVFILMHKKDLVSAEVAESKRRMVEEWTYEALHHVEARAVQKLANRRSAGSVNEASRGRRRVDLKQFFMGAFCTTIWDDSLYSAWSMIVSTLIPNLERIKKDLMTFSRSCNATEVVIFESNTWLVVCSVSNRSKGSTFIEGGAQEQDHDQQQKRLYERISSVIKTFKYSCVKGARTQFESIQICEPDFTLVMDAFTEDTHVLIVCENAVEPRVLTHMIETARPHFKSIQSSKPKER